MAWSDAVKARLMVYCRLNELAPGEDVLLESLYNAAVGYMADAGISEPDAAVSPERRAQYDLCIDYLVLDMWDRRDMTITGTIVAVNPAFQRMKNQLKLTEPAVSDFDTAGADM